MPVHAFDVRTVLAGRGVGPGLRVTAASDRLTVRELIERTLAAIIAEARATRAAGDARTATLFADTFGPIIGGDGLYEYLLASFSVSSAISTSAEFGRTLRAFEDGEFEIRLNGRRVGGLDEVVELTVRTRVLFLRTVRVTSG